MQTAEIPVSNSDRPCIVDQMYAIWFQDKTLVLDQDGVFYLKNGRKYYVHDQVMTLAVKDGLKELPPWGKTKWRLYLRSKCDPDIQKFFIKSTR